MMQMVRDSTMESKRITNLCLNLPPYVPTCQFVLLLSDQMFATAQTELKSIPSGEREAFIESLHCLDIRFRCAFGSSIVNKGMKLESDLVIVPGFQTD